MTFSLLSTTRYDNSLLSKQWNTAVNGGQPSPFFLLPYHLDRLSEARACHGWTDTQQSLTLTSLTKACLEAVAAVQGEGPYRVRIVLGENGTLSVTTALVKPLFSSNPLDTSVDIDTPRIVYIDPEPISSSIFTTTKTTKREVYNAARARVGLAPMPTLEDAHIDVLLHNQQGYITETSIRNVAFRKNDQWVTPSRRSGCLPGVVRRKLLEDEIIIEGNIKIEDVQEGELVMTSNGVEGCGFAKVMFYSVKKPT